MPMDFFVTFACVFRLIFRNITFMIETALVAVYFVMSRKLELILLFVMGDKI